MKRTFKTVFVTSLLLVSLLISALALTACNKDLTEEYASAKAASISPCVRSHSRYLRAISSREARSLEYSVHRAGSPATSGEERSSPSFS